MTSSKLTVRPQDINSDANAQAFMFKMMLMGKAFIDLAVVNEVSGDGKTVVVTQLVSGFSGDGQTIPNGKIYNVPVWILQRGSSAVVMTPVAGDIGVILCCDRDISTVKHARKESPPASSRNHNECDAIYLGGCLNNDPLQYVKFSDDGIDIVSPLVVNIDAPSIYINGSSKLSLNSPNIILNGEVSQGAGSNAGNFNFAGNITAKGEVTGKGINLSSHVHGGVESGDSDTQGPK